MVKRKIIHGIVEYQKNLVEGRHQNNLVEGRRLEFFSQVLFFDFNLSPIGSDIGTDLRLGLILAPISDLELVRRN